jgi:acyl-CoA thioester hydrolase
MSTPILSEITEVKVRFSEVDALKIVWHGNYIKYFEEGREAFGKKYGIDYLTIQQQGLLTPIVHVQCDYKRPLEYGDIALVETVFNDQEAAKICFGFTIRKKSSGEIAATGSSIQVFLDHQRQLLLTPPVYFLEWKKKWGLQP